MFDFIGAFAGIIILSPLFVLGALLVTVGSGFPVLYRQKRVGKSGMIFNLYKFRTMVNGADKDGAISYKDDPRITKTGNFLRHFKLDELPQLFNIIKGDMSFVGPRPDVPEYASYLEGRYKEILTVRPGITSPASIQFRNESELFTDTATMEAEYTQKILPQKLELNLKYVKDASFWYDMRIIIKTILLINELKNAPRKTNA